MSCFWGGGNILLGSLGYANSYLTGGYASLLSLAREGTTYANPRDLQDASIVEFAIGGIAGMRAAAGRIAGISIAGERAVPEGIVYLRTDITGKITLYGGQAMNDARYLARQAEHAREFPDSEFKFTIIDRANPGSALDIAEHNFIQELTGGVAARRSSAVSNLRDPVGAARRPTFGLPEPR